MESITDLAPEIRKRISDFTKFLSCEGINRPKAKFTGAILTAMLKEPHVQLTVLSRSLSEKISDIPSYQYYMITAAVARTMEFAH